MAELLTGTLDLLVLRVLSPGPLHGFGIGERIHMISRKALDIEEGSLYPSLYRMEAKGWLKAEWGQSDRGRRARLYSLTKAGRGQLEIEHKNWSQTALAIAEVLKNA